MKSSNNAEKVEERMSILKPIKNRVIVKLVEKEKVTSSGIVLANVDREAVSKGEILAVGPDCEYFEVGQIILANWNKAAKTKFEAVEYWIVPEDEIVLIFEGEVT